MTVWERIGLALTGISLGILGFLRLFLREERVFSDRAEVQIARLDARLNAEQRRCDALERELFALKARIGLPPDEPLADHPPGDWPPKNGDVPHD